MTNEKTMKLLFLKRKNSSISIIKYASCLKNNIIFH